LSDPKAAIDLTDDDDDEKHGPSRTLALPLATASALSSRALGSVSSSLSSTKRSSESLSRSSSSEVASISQPPVKMKLKSFSLRGGYLSDEGLLQLLFTFDELQSLNLDHNLNDSLTGAAFAKLKFKKLKLQDLSVRRCSFIT